MPASSDKYRPDANKSPRLGRGLSALMGVPASPVRVEVPLAHSPPVAAPDSHSPDPTSTPIRSQGSVGLGVTESENTLLSDLFSLPLDSLRPNIYQPRKNIADTDLPALAASIRSAGVMQPVIVRPARRDGTGRAGGGGAMYEIVAGERRWRAAQLAGLTHIPAIIRELNDAQAAEWALVENVQREDLNAMDRALALKKLCERFHVTHADLGARIGLDRSTIANLIRLTELEPEIADLISKNLLGAGHGKALLGAPAGPARVRLAQDAAERSYSVRRLEFEAKQLGKLPLSEAPLRSALPSPREAVLRDIEKRISQALGTKVLIRTDPTGKRGQITLDFYDLDQFDGLLSRLGVSLL